MTTSAAREREYGTVVWSGPQKFLNCPAEHLYKFRDGSMERLQFGMEGHDFFCCRDCHPASYFFVVFSLSPDKYYTAYLVSESCYKEWAALPHDVKSLSTLEMLHLIKDPLGRSYNPAWRGK